MGTISKREQAIIFGAAEMPSPLPEYILKELDSFFLIAADGGYRHFESLGIRPDLAVGDFDSLGALPTDCPVIKHPVMKDDTDMLLAIREGLSRGIKRFFILGGTGGRFDHTFANIQSLLFAKKEGAKAFLIGNDEVMTVLLPKEKLFFDRRAKGIVSVFSLSALSEGVNIKGLLYPLEKGRLENSFPLGVSNELVGRDAEISLEKGELLVIMGKDAFTL